MGGLRSALVGIRFVMSSRTRCQLAPRPFPIRRSVSRAASCDKQAVDWKPHSKSMPCCRRFAVPFRHSLKLETTDGIILVVAQCAVQRAHSGSPRCLRLGEVVVGNTGEDFLPRSSVLRGLVAHGPRRDFQAAGRGVCCRSHVQQDMKSNDAFTSCDYDRAIPTVRDAASV